VYIQIASLEPVIRNISEPVSMTVMLRNITQIETVLKSPVLSAVHRVVVCSYCSFYYDSQAKNTQIVAIRLQYESSAKNKRIVAIIVF
jgi:hypothetical protein